MKRTERLRDKLTVFLFILFIFSFGFCTIVTGYRTIGKSAIEGYKQTPDSVAERLKGFLSGAERGFNEAFFKRLLFIDVHGAVQLAFGKTIIEDVNPLNTVYKLDNGQLTFAYPKYDVSDIAGFISNFNGYLASHDIPLIYVQAPFKIPKYHYDTGVGAVDFSNINADNLLSQLDAEGVRYLDLREKIHESETPHHEYFYNTDHHWTSGAGFWAYTKVADYILEVTDVPLEGATITTNFSNYNVEVYPQSFLGSQGRRVGRLYAGLDDFELITPKFETNYIVEISTHKGSVLKRQGTFDKSLIDRSVADMGLPVSTNRYATYLGGDYPSVKIKNLGVSEGKLLIIQDSFGLVFSPFLSLNFAETHIVDLRHRRLEILEYVAEEQFDIVIFLYNAGFYRADNMDVIKENLICGKSELKR